MHFVDIDKLSISQARPPRPFLASRGRLQKRASIRSSNATTL